MSEPTDPPRWSQADSGAPPVVSALLRDGQRDVPSAAESDAMFARLSPKLSPAPVASVPQGVPWSRIGKVLGALAIAAAGALVVRALSAPESAPLEPASPPTAAPPRAPVLPAPRATRETTPSVEPTASTVSKAQTTTRAAPKMGEAELLEAARRALAKDPGRALRLTERHKAAFPNGVLQQEREVIAIEALRKLGRSNAASSRANQFENEFPDSAHRRGVEAGRGKP